MIVEAALAVAFSFSRTGGNIRPFHARVAPSGAVTVDGRHTGRLSAARLDRLRRIADTSFAGLPARITCAGVLPDIATRNVTLSSGRKVWSVTVRGSCSTRFERMYRALASVPGVS